MMGTFYTNLRQIFAKTLSLSPHFFRLREALYSGHVKLSVEVSEPFTHSVCRLVIARKTAPPSSSFRGPKDRSRRVLNRYCWEDEGQQYRPSLQFLPCAKDWWTVWHCYAGGRRNSSSFLAEIFEFVVPSSLISAHNALNWLWHFSPRIPLTRSLHCLRRH